MILFYLLEVEVKKRKEIQSHQIFIKEEKNK